MSQLTRTDQPASIRRLQELARRNPSELAIMAIAALAFALRCLWLQDQSLSMDEIGELTIARTSLPDIFRTHDGFPPLYNSLLHGWLLLFPADQSARWLSAIVGTAAVVIVWGLARSVGGSRTAAWAALLVAVSPFQIWHAQEGRAYILFYMLAAGALWAFVRAIETDSPRAWATYVALCLTGLVTHYYFALFVLADAAVLLTEWRGRAQARAIAAHTCLAVLSLLILWPLRGDFSAEEAAPFATAFHPAAVGYSFFSFLSGYALGPSPRELHTLGSRSAFLDVLPWLVLLGTSACILLARGVASLGARLWIRRLVLFSVLPVVACVALSGAMGVTFQVRHVLWASIVPMVVMGAGLARSGNGAVEKGALVVLLAGCAISRYQRHTQPRYQNEDMRGLAGFLQTTGSHEPVFVLTGYMSVPVQHYLGDAWTVNAVPDAGPGPAGLQTALRYVDSATTPATRFWFVYTREFHGDASGQFLDSLSHRRALECAERFVGITLCAGGGHGTFPGRPES